MKRILFLISAFLLVLPCFADVNANFNVRSGITNSLNLFDLKEYQQIAFFGGDTLNGKTPYPSVAVSYIQQKFPGANISLKPFPDAGGSWYGAFRVARGEPVFGATVHNACLVFIDFAPDDYSRSGEEITCNWEGIVRGLLSFRRSMDIVFVYTLSPAILADYNAGKEPAVIQYAERAAAHYNIPSVNLAKAAFEKIKSGSVSAADFFVSKETAKPSPKGEAIYSEVIKQFLDACLAARTTEKKIIGRNVPNPLSSNNLEHAQIIGYDASDYPKTWRAGKQSPLPYFRHILYVDRLDSEMNPKEVITFKFTGAAIGLLDLIDKYTSQFEYSVDNSEWQTVSGRTSSEEPKVRITKLAEGLDAAKEHTLVIRLPETRKNDYDITLQIGAFLADGSVKDTYAGISPLEKADAVYAAMEPVEYTPPKDRWKYIPKTMEKLKNGGTLKIVMLGDSIMGDTGSSQFDKVLEQKYPNCKIEKIMSLRGSTGCWWYKEDNRIESYVLKHNPDLLMIGGISQRQDTESIRSVIHQIREKQNPEIMLITPVFGSESDAHIKNWTFDIDASKYAYRADLKKLADEENCEFVDLTGITWQYMMNSGKCYGWFKRDAVHANHRGFQVIGRHLVRYFEP